MRHTVQREVADAYIDKILETFAKFFKDAPADLKFILIESEAQQKVIRFFNADLNHIANGFPADLHIQSLLSQPCAVTFIAGGVGPISTQKNAILDFV